MNSSQAHHAPGFNMDRKMPMATLINYKKYMFDKISEQQTLAGRYETAAQLALNIWNETLDRIVQ